MTKTKRLIFLLAGLWLCAASTILAQNNSNDLVVTAEASLLPDPQPRLFLQVYLLNNSDKEITVLTKNLNLSTSSEKQGWTYVLGYEGAVHHDGNPIMPSLYDFSPVTLKPKEKALITKELTGGRSLRSITNDTPLTLRYVVSKEWGERFKVWSGTTESKPFQAKVRKPQP